MSKRSIESFLSPTAKKAKIVLPPRSSPGPPSTHATYPFPIASLPFEITSTISSDSPILLNHKPNLDCVYHRPFLRREGADALFEFLRRELPWYKVIYQHSLHKMLITTPRYTSVFGIDSTSRFTPDGQIMDANTKLVLPPTSKRYKCKPRPIPSCLLELKEEVERVTGYDYNFILVNYYKDGTDSISYHSDDEQFLGPNPAIASLTLGATRTFLLKHKNATHNLQPISFELRGGEMILMKGETQRNWLHSIPKRKNAGGRINITFRKGVVRGATENYNTYNVGVGPVLRWSERHQEMREWMSEGEWEAAETCTKPEPEEPGPRKNETTPEGPRNGEVESSASMSRPPSGIRTASVDPAVPPQTPSPDSRMAPTESARASAKAPVLTREETTSKAWTCPMCTLENACGTLQCDACGGERPGDV
ncbi:hypothetical protein SAICODRAFT_73677 [Saitoella complicata NRRL Y-17804]|uniref:uncharacterized protein n=1 Tax=Saitoella complicata (strain BCRC 22490 / CBS 7301 / JCM 7358 / NBRC 10748 / NRRL Y-17804) TaxID=698492 RepID=UPI000866C765|nr:uncharacterized protein SAICODRAFT_73677 [Saitoella complicata NRRL Y-17804]ODQ50157.1 hypothetical protein SAICODRAFT_73677 [Saitoella complicata NRRL Y-17804]